MNKVIFVLVLCLSQGFGQQCDNPGHCRESGCCLDNNQGPVEPDWQDGTNCTSQIPKNSYEASCFSLLKIMTFFSHLCF